MVLSNRITLMESNKKKTAGVVMCVNSLVCWGHKHVDSVEQKANGWLVVLGVWE